MIIEKKDGRLIIWSSKLSNSPHKLMVHRLWFNKYSNEIEFCDNGFFGCKHYSIEELESMLKYLKKKNKEVVKK